MLLTVGRVVTSYYPPLPLICLPYVYVWPKPVMSSVQESVEIKQQSAVVDKR